jgi:hypothetical protein
LFGGTPDLALPACEKYNLFRSRLASKLGLQL